MSNPTPIMGTSDEAALLITPLDTEAVAEGVWVKYYSMQFKVRRTTDAEYKSKLLRVSDEFQKQRDNGADLGELEKSFAPRFSRLIANHILVDWKGKNARGQDIPTFSKELAYKMLMADQDLRMFLRDYADEKKNFFEGEVQKSLGE